MTIHDSVDRGCKFHCVTFGPTYLEWGVALMAERIEGELIAIHFSVPRQQQAPAI